MTQGVTNLVSAGPLIVALPIALAAGMLSFFSPCCLPLVPGYLGYLSGLAGNEVTPDHEPDPPDRHGGPRPTPETRAVAVGAPSAPVALLAPPNTGTAATRARSSRTLLAAGLFVFGFSAVFVSYGALFGGAGFALQRHQVAVTRALGVVTVVLGLLFAGVITSLPWLRVAARTARLRYRPRWGLSAAPVLGGLFAVGWTPCIGPTLAAVLLLSSDTGTASRGALLAFGYAIGLGVPFLLIAGAFQHALKAMAFARRHAVAITRVGGGFLAGIGVLELTGAWTTLVVWVQVHLVSGTTLPL